MDFFMYFFAWFISLGCILILYNRYYAIHHKYKNLVGDYNDLVQNRTALKELYRRVIRENEKLVKKYNANVTEYNELLAKYKWATRTGPKPKFEDTAFEPPKFKPVGKNEFSYDELKRIRFVMHPDKNGGKTTELWRKINEMMEN